MPLKKLGPSLRAERSEAWQSRKYDELLDRHGSFHSPRDDEFELFQVQLSKMKLIKRVQDYFHQTSEDSYLRHARKIVIFVFGITIFLIGVAMIFLPGPALVVIPLSLVVLGTEFVWARRLLKGIRHQTNKIRGSFPWGRKKK